MRVRFAFAAFTLLALAGFHLAPSDAAPQPQAPVSAPVASYGPTRADRDRALIAALTAVKAQQDADVALWVANAPKPRPRVTSHVSREPSSAPPIEPVAYDAGSIEALVCSIFVDSCGRAIRVFTCESGLNPSARNRSGASGVAQIMLPMHADMFEAHGWDWRDSWMDPYRNLIVAYDLSRAGTNWGPWVCK